MTELHPSLGSVPSPDPTVLTTAALYREVAAVRELFTQRVDALTSERDRATAAAVLRMETLNRERMEQLVALRELLEGQIAGLEALVNEKFLAAERLRVEQKKDTKDAVDAALSAAKEAVKEQTTASGLSISKSETATREQLKQQQETFTTSIEGLRRSIDELKDREVDDIRILRQSISDVSSVANGYGQQKVGATADRTSLYATAAAIGAAIVAVVAVVGFILSNVRTP
jgi:hypothetical protein